MNNQSIILKYGGIVTEWTALPMDREQRAFKSGPKIAAKIKEFGKPREVWYA